MVALLERQKPHHVRCGTWQTCVGPPNPSIGPDQSPYNLASNSVTVPSYREKRPHVSLLPQFCRRQHPPGMPASGTCTSVPCYLQTTGHSFLCTVETDLRLNESRSQDPVVLGIPLIWRKASTARSDGARSGLPRSRWGEVHHALCSFLPASRHTHCDLLWVNYASSLPSERRGKDPNTA